jgi:hypothetical protein
MKSYVDSAKGNFIAFWKPGHVSDMLYQKLKKA